jgi:hypothetical protein
LQTTCAALAGLDSHAALTQVFGANRNPRAQALDQRRDRQHHITSIFNKLGVYNRLELTLFAFHHGIVEK